MEFRNCNLFIDDEVRSFDSKKTDDRASSSEYFDRTKKNSVVSKINAISKPKHQEKIGMQAKRESRE